VDLEGVAWSHGEDHMLIYHQVILGGKQEARWITKHRFIKHPLNLG